MQIGDKGLSHMVMPDVGHTLIAPFELTLNQYLHSIF